MKHAIYSQVEMLITHSESRFVSISDRLGLAHVTSPHLVSDGMCRF